MPGPDFDDVELFGPPPFADDPEEEARIRQRVREQVEEADVAALLMAELAMACVTEPIESAPLVELLATLSQLLQDVREREEAELNLLRKRVHDQAVELGTRHRTH